jgi:polyisoprenoid-binding protein YceI
VVKRITVLGVVLALIAVGAIAYSFLKTPEEASGPIEAIPVVVEQPESVEPTLEPSSTMAPAASKDTGSEGSAGLTIFEIVQAESEARFIIDEVLNGAPKTVVGTTDQVAGELAIYVDDPTQSEIGTILVNARTLVTDNEFRNRAIKNRILNTNDHEFVAFAPTEIIGLPDKVTIGESFSFQIVGDLTVRNITKQVTFEVSVTPVSESQLEGSATSTILHADFDLTIPDAPAVASVADKVILEIEFVAAAK